MRTNSLIPSDVRAAVAAFLNGCQNEARPFATSEALGAIRAIFPGLDIADAELEDAISSEAVVAGFDIHFDAPDGLATVRRKALERWDNEGGAIGKAPRTEAQ